MLPSPPVSLSNFTIKVSALLLLPMAVSVLVIAYSLSSCCQNGVIRFRASLSLVPGAGMLRGQQQVYNLPVTEESKRGAFAPDNNLLSEGIPRVAPTLDTKTGSDLRHTINRLESSFKTPGSRV